MSMKIKVIDTGFFKLDGGAMFGVVPKQMWNRLNPADENNMCTWAMRCLLIDYKGQRVLIDTGMGDKQDDKFKSHFEPHGDHDLLTSLQKHGYTKEDITDVFLTHLHFDHSGGAVLYNENGDLVPTFPNAKYWSNEVHYKWANTPNPREKASFLSENHVPLSDANVLHFLDVKQDVRFNDWISVRFVYGHTEAMMLPEIELPNGKKLIFMADLLPASVHVRMPYVMSYDLRPLVTLEEKKFYYERYLNDDTYLFFEHDKDHAFGQLKQNDRGRFEIKIVDSIDQMLA